MPIELIVSFSSLSRWYEQKLEQPEKIVKSSKNKNESLIADHDAMSVAESRIIFFKRLSFFLNI